MGMDRTVTFPGGCPPWPEVAALLARHGRAVQMRMIDGELAFPDETPPAGWAEIRVGTAQGMVTLRRQPRGGGEAVAVVTWGNADAAARGVWDALAWALAAAGGGVVETEAGPVAADEFARQAGLG